MLISTYNPESKACCPKCGLVNCYNTGGNIAFGDRYLDFRHDKCGTEWRQYIDKSVSVVLKERVAQQAVECVKIKGRFST